MTFDPSVTLAAGDLDLELASLNGKTMSVRRVRYRAMLKFNNKDCNKKLLIMSPAAEPPFEVAEGQDPVSWFEVLPGKTRVVRVSPAYKEDPPSQFTYTALIDGSAAEDPIVIVDRR